MIERFGSGVGDRLRIALRSPGLVVGIAIIAFWTACALFGERIAPFDPYADDLLETLAAPSLVHPFGTDQLGRDILSRVMIGSTDLLTVSLLATLLGTLAGTLLGLALGYFGGVFDALASRIIEALQALPLIIIALIALAAVGTSNLSVILVIAFTFTLLIARTVRSAVKIEMTLDYIAAARLRGDGGCSVMFVEILPNVVPLVVVEMTVRLGFAIFFVASLSFLGFGIQPPSPDWGLAIAENYGLIGSYWWTVLFDAGAIASLIIGFVLVAEALQELFDR